MEVLFIHIVQLYGCVPTFRLVLSTLCYSNCRADDPDGEFSGFSLTTHILQNERYDTTDPSTDELPLMMLRPFAVVCRLTQTPKRIISSL